MTRNAIKLNLALLLQTISKIAYYQGEKAVGYI